ncbi:hypothetical protein ABW19_dt0210359 [Dactylella cylindrospora]|nr:hypothetical protein ABW19_dt0210359 [Dactylella cylindrospora]
MESPNLLTIPPEIRLMVLEYLLISQNFSEETGQPEVWPYSSTGDYSFAAFDEKTPALYPQILRTCKKIYEEGIALLYSKNTFCIHPPEADAEGEVNGIEQAGKFFRIVGAENAHLIRKVTVGGGSKMLKTDQLKDCLQLGSGLVELRVLSIGPRCQAPYNYMLQYYLNIQAAMKASSTHLVHISSVIPNGFIPEGISLIYLVFHAGNEPRMEEEMEVKLDESLDHFREKVHEQEKEWQKLGWNSKSAYIFRICKTPSAAIIKSPSRLSMTANSSS